MDEDATARHMNLREGRGRRLQFYDTVKRRKTSANTRREQDGGAGAKV